MSISFNSLAWCRMRNNRLHTLAAGLFVASTLCSRPAPAFATSPEEIRRCLYAAASVHRVPPDLLYAILSVEAGRPGLISHNSNGSVDIGPMQVNDFWLPALMLHWSTTRASAYLALRDSVCANFEAGAWILEQAIRETDDFWDGVARYHSHSGPEKQIYLGRLAKTFRQIQRDRNASPEAPPAHLTDNQDS